MDDPIEFRNNVAIVVHKNKQILLVHKPRKRDNWQFPQGGVDENEKEHEAVIRELQEETGNNPVKIIKKSALTYSYIFPQGYTRYSDSGKNFKGQTQSFWLVEFLGDKKDIILDKKELDKCEWIDPRDIKAYIERKEYLEVCEKVLKEFKLV